VFALQHSSSNNDRAVELQQWLAANGWDDVFLDLDPQRGIVAGQRWKEALQKAAHRCEVVLALISTEWLASGWCKAEIDAARLMGKKIIVALIGVDKSLVPLDLADEQWVDLDRDPDARTRLKEGLKRVGLDPLSFPFEAGRRPYPGFAFLEEEDAAIFFGRDAPIVRGLDKTRGLVRAGVDRMLVILGASGSGKSSFLRAGLWPRLKRDDRTWLPLPIIRPERAVMSGSFGLAQALQKIMGEPAFAEEIRKRDLPRSRAAIQEFLEKTEDGLVKIFAALRDIAHATELSGGAASPPTVVLAVDQGEELFNGEGRDEARRFIEILTRTLNADPEVLAIVAMRSDAFPQLQTDPSLAQLSKDTFTLDMMLEGSYRAVIEGPAQLIQPNRLKIDPQLTDALLEDLSGQDALPLLAFTLAYLYERYAADNELNLAGYEKLGRLKGVIDATVSETFAEGASKGELPKDAKAQLALARAAFIPHLAQVNAAGQFVRRVATRDEIPAEARPLVDRFAERRLLIKDRRSIAGKDVEVIEVAHEALLREWRELHEALLSEREFLVAKGQLEQDVAEWRAAPQSSKEGALLSGNKLLRARDWLAARPQDLSVEERLFIEASVALLRRNDDEKEAARQTEVRRQQELAEAAVKLANERGRRAKIAILGAAISVGFAAYGAYEAYTANQNKQIAEKQAGIALSRQLAAQASYQAKSDQLDRALLLSVEAERAADTSEARSALFTSLQAKPRLLQYLRARGSSIDSMAANAFAKQVLLGASDGSLILWDIENRAQSMVWRAENGGSIPAVAFDKTGQTAALVTDAKRISVWSLSATAKRLSEFSVPADKKVSVVALSPDGKIVAAGTDGGMTLWNAKTGELLDGGLAGEAGDIYALTFDPEGKTLAAAYDHKVVLWEVASRKRIEPALTGHPLAVNSLAYSPDGKLLTSASSNQIFLWDALTHQQLGDPGKDDADSSVIRALHFVDNTHLISAGDGGAITRWLVLDQRLSKEPVVEKVGSGDSDQIAVASGGTAIALRSSGRVVLWDLSSGRSLGRLENYGHDIAVSSLALDGGGRHLAVGGDGASIFWDTVDHKQIGSPLVHPGDRADSIALSRDGRLLAVGTCAAEEESPVERHRGKFCSKGKIIIWTLGAAGAPSMITGHESQVTRLAFNPEGTTLASASWDHTVMLWNVKDGRQLGPPVKADAVLDLAFASDGNDFLVRSMGGIVRRGKLTRDGLEHGILIRLDDSERGYPLGLMPFASSRDGNIWALDQPKANSVVLWDKSTGRELGPELAGHIDTVRTAAFSGDGRLLATVDAGQQIMLWDLNPESWAERACIVANRNLNWDEWLQSFPERPYRKTCDRLPVPYSVVKGTFDDTRELLPGGQSKSAVAMAWAEEIGNPEVFNAVCWEESLAGMAKMAAPFCERAVALAPSRADFRDSRGLCRALIGDSRGAIEDFTFFAKWKKENSEGDWSESWKKREDWVARLEKGENPFDPKTLAEQGSAAFAPAE